MSTMKDRLIRAAELLDMDPDDLLTRLNGESDTFPVGTIDPDGLLARIRNLLDDYRIAAAAHEPTDRAAGFLVADVERLDRHLSNGGDLPAAWKRSEQAPVTEPLYRVGDPDPTTPPGTDSTAWCPAYNERWRCTWPKGHAHPDHICGNGRRVLAVWPK